MGDLLQPTHLILLAVIAFVLFGAKRLPELGKGLGEGLRGFKEGIKGIGDPVPPTTTVQQQNVAPAQPVSAPVEPQIVRKEG
jgi:sec-independent protein translocase protein TatA